MVDINGLRVDIKGLRVDINGLRVDIKWVDIKELECYILIHNTSTECIVHMRPLAHCTLSETETHWKLKASPNFEPRAPYDFHHGVSTREDRQPWVRGWVSRKKC